ncbi:MAG: hypothetical protein PHE79_09745 [Eubacteriales bacterium]|nr:hypothetical protein [Eubacteriales bacterium]
MNQITLSNGTTIDVVQINGQSRFFQGANRDTLEFHFVKSGNSFDNLDALFTATNTARIIVSGEPVPDGNGGVTIPQYFYDDYSLRAGMALIPIVVTPADGTNPEVTEERYTVTMAQKTYTEKQMESLQETVDIFVLESLGV